MTDINKIAESAMLLGGVGPKRKSGTNGYTQGMRHPYLKAEGQMYTERVGELADNVFEAQCQGFNENDFYEYEDVLIRSAPAVNAATGELMPDDWQRIYVVSPAEYDELRPGAYIKFADNTWVVYKGENIGSALGSAIVRRCNSVIHALDFYGNIQTVPMSFAKMGTLSNASHATENSIVAKNYMQCVCQLNNISRELAENSRIILGKTAYSMRGLNDFTREFTDDEGSIHLLSFTIEKSEPLEQDSIEKQCADYKSFSWELAVTANGTMRTGTSQKIKTESIRMGEKVQSSTEKPIDYIYSSSNASLTVDAEGTVYAAENGAATITVALAQNPTVKREISIEAAESGGTYVAFTSSPLSELAEYETAEVSAALFQNGEATDAPVRFSLSGADGKTYSAEILTDRSIRVSCYGASMNPLIIKAESGGQEAVMTVRLTA